MSLASGFLGGAQDRLLAASIPFRFFLAAAAFQIAAWACLLVAADQVAGFAGGPGPVLAASHLTTLGVFAMTAIGASYQLLPVVTRRPLARDWPARFSFWLLLPGICLLAWGMGYAQSLPMRAGAVLVTTGLAVCAVLTADNLRRAGSMPLVAAHGWAALLALTVLAGLGVMLVWDMNTGFLEDHGGLAVIHMLFAGYGFMGLLTLGFSLVLVPMFALSRSLPQGPGWVQLGLALLGLSAIGLGLLAGMPALSWLGVAAGAGAVAAYLWLMRAALAKRMRKRLGLSFVLIRASWGLLALGLIFGALVLVEAPIPNAAALFGFLLLAGWLLTFLTGILQRIMPFLASMHASDATGLPPPLSGLTAEIPLKLHAACHAGALAACSAGILADETLLIRTGAATGVFGAVAFAVFAVNVPLQLRATRRSA